MNTTLQQSIDGPLPLRHETGIIDRAALRLGTALTAWAHHAAARRTDRIALREVRSGRARERAWRRVEHERGRWRDQPSLLFRNLQ